MSGGLWAIGTGIVAAAMCGLAMLALHWAVFLAIGRDPHPLACYSIGCGGILLALGGWCLAQGTIPAWWAWLATAGITAGAGLGTAAGHALDAWAGRARGKAFCDGQRAAEADRRR